MMTTTVDPAPPVRTGPVPPTNPSTPWRGLTLAMATLAALLTAAAVLGPLVLEVVTYRTSPTTLNQLLGSDAAVLLVVAPAAAAAAVLSARRSPLAPVLAGGVGVFVVYTYAQVVIGQEYLRLPGNVERFFPLYLAVVVLGQAAVVLAARGPRLPRPSRRLERIAAITLLLEAVFLVVGLHLPTMLTAWRDPGALTDYATSPTPFWLVKLMDLGVVVPASLAAGIGLLRGATWARRLMHTLLTACTGLGASVTAMAVMMLLHDDPGASPGLATGFAGFTLVFTALTAAAYRSLGVGAPRAGDRTITG